MSVDPLPAPQVVVAFDSLVSTADRRDLLIELSACDISARRGLDLGLRGPDPNHVETATVAVLTMLSTGFVERFGEQAADRVSRLFVAVREWLRRFGDTTATTSSSALAQIEIFDRASGVEVRVSANDPDSAARLLADTVSAAKAIRHAQPMPGDDDGWSPDAGAAD